MAADPLLRRRNGRPQACDPCRSRKVSCDHAQPVCLRCQRRKQQQQCVYTITSHSVSSLGRAQPSRPPGARTRQALPSTGSSSRSSPPSHHAAPSPRTNSTTSGSDSPAATAATPAPRQSGYLGYTSYSAVYQETSHSLSRLQGAGTLSLPGLAPASIRSNSGVPAAVPEPVLSPLTREMALAVLRSLPGLNNAALPSDISTSLCDGWARTLASRILPCAQAFLRRGLDDANDDNDDSRLEDLAKLLCANTAKPINEDLTTDLDGWLGQFTGDNLRWESLGLLFICKHMWPGRRAAGQEAPLTCVAACIDLAKKFPEGNLMQLYVCHRRMILESTCDKGVGDAGLACWRAHGEAVSLLTFLGLHADTHTDTYTPTFVSELRRRLFAYVFNIDKVVTSFQGRPPMLSAHYVSPPLPLDIPDAAFLGDEVSLRRAVEDLDEDGWRTVGNPSTATVIRARCKLAYIKDQLIGLALSSNRPTSVETLLDIKNRASNVYHSFPRTLRYSPADIFVDENRLDNEVLYVRLLLRIEYLQNLFFAERLIQRHAAANNQHQQNMDAGGDDLLLISFDMVALTLMFWMHKDRFVEMTKDFEWLLMNYAAPGGGILCMELLRPTYTGPHHPRNSSITRSAIIQKLGLLVGFLSWVGPDAPNADLCCSCRTVIQHVLDHTLNGGGGGAMAQQQQQQDVDADGHPLGDALGQAMDVDNFLSFDLLDTYDWLRPDDMGAEGMSLRWLGDGL